jgi:hypothetical protein
MKNTKNTSYWKDVEKMPIYNINKYIYYNLEDLK